LSAADYKSESSRQMASAAFVLENMLNCIREEKKEVNRGGREERREGGERERGRDRRAAGLVLICKETIK
jgi:hypothetical protein